jgi:hypothetical protein
MLPLEKEQQNGGFRVHPVLNITVVLGFKIVKLKPNNSQELKLLYSSCIVDSSSSSSGSDIFSAISKRRTKVLGSCRPKWHVVIFGWCYAAAISHILYRCGAADSYRSNS